MSRLQSALAIAASGVLAPIITNAWVDYGAIDFGAIVYLVIPTCVGLSSILFFLLLDELLEKYRIAVTIIFILINLLTGIVMRLDLHYHFFHF